MISESLPSTPRRVGLTGCMNRGRQAPIPFRSGGYATRRPVPVVGDGWRGWRRWDIGFFWKLNLGRISIFVACHLLVLLVPRRAFLNGEICYSNTLFKMQEFLCRTLNFFGAAWVSLQFLVKWKKFMRLIMLVYVSWWPAACPCTVNERNSSKMPKLNAFHTCQVAQAKHFRPN
jgi:hypothetical protein